MKYSFWIAAFLLTILPACNKKIEETEKKEAEFKKIAFTPPQDSSITVEQMKKWHSCNSRLDSLSDVYLDSFRTENPESRMRYQRDFIKLQDHICIQQGLLGGYDEYVWILNNSGNKKNETIFDSLTIKIPKKRNRHKH